MLPLAPHSTAVTLISSRDKGVGKCRVTNFMPGGVFEVIKQLPGNNEPEYRIKSANEPHERVARESELDLA